MARTTRTPTPRRGKGAASTPWLANARMLAARVEAARLELAAIMTHLQGFALAEGPHSEELALRALEAAEAARDVFRVAAKRESLVNPAKVRRAILILDQAREALGLDPPLRPALVDLARSISSQELGVSSHRRDAAAAPPERWEKAIATWRGVASNPGGRPKKGAVLYRWELIVFELLTGTTDPADALDMRQEWARQNKRRLRT